VRHGVVESSRVGLWQSRNPRLQREIRKHAATLAIGSRAGVATIGAGVQLGAVVGFLLWFTTDFILYGITNIANLTRTVVDPLLECVRGGISGAVIAAVLGWVAAPGRGKTARG
jgi:hypothetical protein